MKLQDKKQVLINYLLMKTDDQDWHAVSDAANDLREIEVGLKYQDKGRAVETTPKSTASKTTPIVKESAPLVETHPTEIEIPHQVNEVANLLKLDDYSLVERLFPDYSQVKHNA